MSHLRRKQRAKYLNESELFCQIIVSSVSLWQMSLFALEDPLLPHEHTFLFAPELQPRLHLCSFACCSAGSLIIYLLTLHPPENNPQRLSETCRPTNDSTSFSSKRRPLLSAHVFRLAPADGLWWSGLPPLPFSTSPPSFCCL